MIKDCPYCSKTNDASEVRLKVIKAGHYRRSSDCRRVQRFKCLSCGRLFSNATGHPCFGQRKRQFNHQVEKQFNSGVSFRQIARNLKLNRKTIDRKIVFLGLRAQAKLLAMNKERPAAEIVEFDDMETYEHTKCKPLSITLAVEHGTRRILGFEVSQMPAKGRLARLSVKKYGPRADKRTQGRDLLFERLKEVVSPVALFKSDENPHYPNTVKRHFPLAKHESFKGQRGSIVGQGELKKVRFDPLFSLNHTCAMLRDNIKRLSRRTWCTTKNPARLRLCIAIYALHHNLSRIESS